MAVPQGRDSLAIGTPSTITVTLEVPATVGTTATLSDNGAGGTFSPTSLTFDGGTSSGPGSPIATFTYTPARYGTIDFTVAVTTPATTFNITGTGSASLAIGTFYSQTRARTRTRAPKPNHSRRSHMR